MGSDPQLAFGRKFSGTHAKIQLLRLLARCGRSSNVSSLHRCRHGKAPQYLVDCCTPVTDVVGRQRLRSATQQMMVEPRHRLSTVGRRAFTVQGPHGLKLPAGRPPHTNR